jgi:hypothetical protein
MELRHLYTRTVTSWPLHKHTTIFPTNRVNTIEKYPMSKERKKEDKFQVSMETSIHCAKVDGP